MPEESYVQSKDDQYKSSHYLTIEHINAQSVMGHLDEIVSLVNDRNIDVLCVSETWLTPIILDKYVNIPNYNIYRHDLKPGGGVCIYVRSDVKVTKIELKVERKNLVEVFGYKYSLKNCHLLSLVLYTDIQKH